MTLLNDQVHGHTNVSQIKFRCIKIGVQNVTDVYRNKNKETKCREEKNNVSF